MVLEGSNANHVKRDLPGSRWVVRTGVRACVCRGPRERPPPVSGWLGVGSSSPDVRSRSCRVLQRYQVSCGSHVVGRDIHPERDFHVGMSSLLGEFAGRLAGIRYAATLAVPTFMQPGFRAHPGSGEHCRGGALSSQQSTSGARMRPISRTR